MSLNDEIFTPHRSGAGQVTNVEPNIPSNPTGRRMKFTLSAYIWGAMIFTISSIPGSRVPILGITGIDKIVHFVEYIILSILVFRSVNTRKLWLIPVLLLFALVDELHQKFIPGRDVEIIDLGVNFVGILSGWWAMRRFCQ